MKKEETENQEQVLKEIYGPNDFGYLCLDIRDVAKQLVKSSKLWSLGHYPHSDNSQG